MKILRLKISVKNLEKQVLFYGKTLDLPVKMTDFGFEVLVGNSILQFSNEVEFENPYHFAFNIPYSLVEKAETHFEGKVNFMADASGKQLVNFDSWNAKALFMFDEDGNVVELIGRQKNPDLGAEEFSASQIMSIGEIGLPADDPKSLFNIGLDDIGLQRYDCDGFNFCAVGDEEGLFILVENSRRNWFPTNIKAKDVWFDLTFEHERKKYFLEVEEGHAKLLLPLPVEFS